jgi:DNA topoisomerase-1
MESSDHPCPMCGSPMVQRQSPRGLFWACSAYPRCRTSREADATGKPIEPPDTGVLCEKCGGPW